MTNLNFFSKVKTFFVIVISILVVNIAVAQQNHLLNDNNSQKKGTTEMDKKVTAGRDQLGNIAPQFAELNDDILFGQVWSREQELSARDRSLVTIVSLIAGGNFEQLKFHLQKGKDNGLSKQEIVEIITHQAFYSGWPKAWSAFNIVKEVYVENDTTKNTILEKSTIFPLGEPVNPEWFIGKAWLKMISVENPFNTPVANVTFSPEARNHWHSHKVGQILLVTGGEGWYQEWGKSAQKLKEGDVVNIPANVKHWHGATKNSWFVHLAITPGETQWFEAVTDEEYDRVNQLNSQTTKEIKQTEYYTFQLGDKVTRQKVSYSNRFGITIAADLYLPKNIDTAKKYAAIVVGTPYGGVKEQGAGIYAQNMAERGFAAIAFDESYNGESGGKPRRVSSPDIFTEDFSAGVDFLGTQPFVDRQKIGAIGLCGSGGFALAAAQVDRRIKAVAAISMYDMSRVKRNGWKDGMTDEQRSQYLDQLAAQRWKDVDNKSPQLTTPFPSEPANKLPEGLDPIGSEFFEYYAMKRGFHPNSISAFTVTSDMSFINFPLLNDIQTISPRPILFIIGEKAHSRYFSEDAYKRAAEPKQLHIVPDARHIDLYDKTDLIPFDKLTNFFNESLK